MSWLLNTYFLYQIKKFGKQLYFDILRDRVHLVHVPSSNPGYHRQWLYFHGPDLMILKPWGEVSVKIIHDLNNLSKKSSAFLKNFHGKIIRYLARNFSSRRFLNSYALAGEGLLDLCRAEGTMPSEEAYARLKKRAAASAIHPGTGAGGSGTSRSRRAISSAFNEGNSEVEAEVTKERKRPWGEDEVSRSLVRRSKDVPRADDAKRGRGLVVSDLCRFAEAYTGKSDKEPELRCSKSSTLRSRPLQHWPKSRRKSRRKCVISRSN